jgi:hypothetical protein
MGKIQNRVKICREINNLSKCTRECVINVLVTWKLSGIEHEKGYNREQKEKYSETKRENIDNLKRKEPPMQDRPKTRQQNE